MFKENILCQKLGIEIPLIQGGMVWTSGYKLASAVSNEGALGVIGAGSMNPELLSQHIQKGLAATDKPLAVNFPLLYSQIERQLNIALDHGIKIFITSAGSPKKYTKMLKDNGATVIHVTSSPELAKKCEDAGVDMVVAEGFEAGGHNGKEELTTLTLIPQVLKAVSIPVIAAGGIGTARSMLAMLVLGASGVQMGTRFLMSQESSAHLDYKNYLKELSHSGATKLSLKKHVPVRLVTNPFATQVQAMEAQGASREELVAYLGKGRARLGMFEGDMTEGELEAGQITTLFSGQEIPTVKEIISSLKNELSEVKKSIL